MVADTGESTPPKASDADAESDGSTDGRAWVAQIRAAVQWAADTFRGHAGVREMRDREP